MSSCVVVSCLFDVDEVAYGSSIPPAAPRFRVDCVVFGVGAVVCTASLSLVSVVIAGQDASSFRHLPPVLNLNSFRNFMFFVEMPHWCYIACFN
jgi:hypothetical protein